jgi:anti-sigma B factor antagonist
MKQWKDQKTIVLPLKGKLMGGIETKNLEERIHRLIQRGVQCLILDLSKVPWANGSGIGCLVGAQKELETAGGSLKLINPSRKVQTIIEMTHLSSILDVTDTVNVYAGLSH